jgi:hypothetical protein
MRSRAVPVAAFLAALLLTAPAFAQRQGGFGFGGGGFGRGGGGLMGLLQMEEVRKEIELLDEQWTAIQKIAEDARNARGQGFDRDAFQNLSDEERRAQFAKLQEEFEKRTKETDAKIKEELVPTQVERLEQLALQQRGSRALADAEVQAKLEFNDEQKKKVETIQEEARAGFGRQGGGNFNLEEFRARQQKTESDMLAVLTDAQKTKFAEMKGKPFTFPERQFGRGGGQGRRPGGDGQGGQNRPRGDGQRQRPNPDT